MMRLNTRREHLGFYRRCDYLVFGFKTNFDHLSGLTLSRYVTTLSEGVRSKNHRGLWFVGSGGWSGHASATIIGVQRHARETALQITDELENAVKV